ncbi:MAG TPA: methyltransferase, partial [Candidatus Dormibacteraeota bacterium]|nr:methyltransferase [Candidatus Dormibacteraeota bacterium]
MRRRPEWFTRFFDAGYLAQLRDEKPPRQTRAEVDFLLRSLDLSPGARILDIPCGYGRHAGELARRGFAVV